MKVPCRQCKCYIVSTVFLCVCAWISKKIFRNLSCISPAFCCCYGLSQFLVPTIWMSSVFLNAPTFFTKRFSEQDYFCTQHWPEQWMAKAHGLAWLLLDAAAPMITMGVLYSRVVYSLWIKRQGQTNCSQKVRINRSIIFYRCKTDHKQAFRCTKIAISWIVFGLKYSFFSTNSIAKLSPDSL